MRPIPVNLALVFASGLVLQAAVADDRILAEKDLREKLTPLQCHVTQEEGTERPFDNEYWDNKKPGI